MTIWYQFNPIPKAFPCVTSRYMSSLLTFTNYQPTLFIAVRVRVMLHSQSRFWTEMSSYRESLSIMFVLFVIPFLLSSHCALGGLHNYTEIHEAKNLVDSLSFKLHSKFQMYQDKYERLKLQSDQYLTQSDSTKDEIKMLNRLKDLLNDLTKKNSICEKFYANFDLIAARQILINSNASLQKDYTVAFEGISVYIEQFRMFLLSLIIEFCFTNRLTTRIKGIPNGFPCRIA